MTEDTIKKKLYTFKHKCSLCDYETNKKQDLKKHQLVHANKVWQCAHCNYKTARESNLKSHTKSIHENVRYHCKLCPYTTTRTGLLGEGADAPPASTDVAHAPPASFWGKGSSGVGEGIL